MYLLAGGLGQPGGAPNQLIVVATPRAGIFFLLIYVFLSAAKLL